MSAVYLNKTMFSYVTEFWLEEEERIRLHPCVAPLTSFNLYFPLGKNILLAVQYYIICISGLIVFFIVWGFLLFLLYAPVDVAVDVEMLPGNLTVSISYEIVRKDLLPLVT